MFEVLKVPMSFTWEIYGDESASYDDCFRMFNPLGKPRFDEVRRRWPVWQVQGLAAKAGCLHYAENSSLSASWNWVCLALHNCADEDDAGRD